MKYLFECLKKIYPNINENDVEIESHNDQEVITSWSYSKPQPTEEQLNEVYYNVLQEIQSDKIRLIGNFKLKELVKNTYQAEVDTFAIQENEAKIYLQNKNPNEVLFIATLAQIRGISLDELAQRIIERSKYFKKYSAILLGIQQKNLDIIWSGKLSLSELESYTWNNFGVI